MAIQDFYNKNEWGRRRLVNVWGNSFLNLDYQNEPFNDSLALAHWHKLGFDQTKFTGDLYDMRRPEPDWIPKIKKEFKWSNFSWALYRMTPGCTLPVHSDSYTKFREIYNVKDTRTIYRAIIFLENWKSGHYFELNGVPILQWCAGDCVWWQWDTPHIAANIGSSDRYTLQITGIKND